MTKVGLELGSTVGERVGVAVGTTEGLVVGETDGLTEFRNYLTMAISSKSLS